jgi:hypothetical protein
MSQDLPTGTAPCCAPQAPDVAKWAVEGRWDAVFDLPNVAAHVSLLPDGKVLFWGRRDRPDGSMNEHECTPWIWDPQKRSFHQTPQPTLGDEQQTKVNLFCAGHAFLPDGRLLVAGGHLQDSHGVNQACVYDYRTNTWTALPLMNNGRWYPSAITLADGSILVASGSYFDGSGTPQNNVPQIFDGHGWHSLAPATDEKGLALLSLYPHWHLLPDGRVVITGTNAQSLLLDTAGAGTWTPAPNRTMLARDYTPSVMYDEGKIIYIGGGNDSGSGLPTDAVEVIDFKEMQPRWRLSAPMHFRRRQQNGTLLPDGTVLVTGGTQGPGFNDISAGQPVHAAELWNPETETWTELAAEAVDRCYHSTAVLLPDATVLSAGSGEGGSDPNVAHREAQIFHPPYLFRGPRPVITSAPAEIHYGETFTANVSAKNVGKISLMRPASVTHAFNQNQGINFLRFTFEDNVLNITAPERPEICPPGHYMLFVLDTEGVPSQAQFVHIGTSAPAKRGIEEGALAAAAPLRQRQAAITAANPGPRVTIGLTSTCPYGLGACWGGAYEALKKLDGVAAVQPIPNAEDSTADVYLGGPGLPNIDLWPDQFARTANGSYDFRGVEVTLAGRVQDVDGALQLVEAASGALLHLRPLLPGTKIQWDREARAPKPAARDELLAYAELLAQTRQSGARQVRVIGPLLRTAGELIVYVRKFTR